MSARLESSDLGRVVNLIATPDIDETVHYRMAISSKREARFSDASPNPYGIETAGFYRRQRHAVDGFGGGSVSTASRERDRAPGRGVGARGRSRSPADLAGYCQAATAGSLTKGSSLNGAMVSRVM
jgi:hypothetical protein